MNNSNSLSNPIQMPQEQITRFKLSRTKLGSRTILSIEKDEMGIGSIFLLPEDLDLSIHVEELVGKFNEKYTVEPPQTTTGRN